MHVECAHAARVREGTPFKQVLGAHALLALGNLCSDSVDPRSGETKALLLGLGVEAALLECFSAEREMERAERDALVSSLRKQLADARTLHEQRIEPTFVALRWISTMLSREFDLPDTIRLWDALLADTEGTDGLVMYTSLAMVLALAVPAALVAFHTS